MPELVGALDQGTTSTRFMIFDGAGEVVAVDQREHRQIFPRPGWVEHDPIEIWSMTTSVIEGALSRAWLQASDLVAVGVTNQRETTVIWDRETGEPVYNAVVWQDTRTAELCVALGGDEGPDRFRAKTGLPLATYFAGPKARQLLDDLDLTQRAERGELAFGTIDSWIAWNLTGGVNGGRHVTDATNASRTLLMDLATGTWDADLAMEIGVPTAILPEIVPSIGLDLECVGPLAGIRLAAILGDQQAALFGQACFTPGEAKNTYGTGNFMLLNTGETPVTSEAGLLTTVAYRWGSEPTVFALEGSVAVTGSLVQWLRDNLGLFEDASEVEPLARSVEDNGDVYFVPAFSGLFAPHWRPDARGVITGLTRFANRGHLARAALESTAFQTRDVLDAMVADSGVDLKELRVDGGMTVNDLLMQFQADILGVDVVRPKVAETTALGAAYGAGLATGLWSGLDEIADLWAEDARWSPAMGEHERERLHHRWEQAVQRSLGWV
ncbi:MAG TPA: glycerol kinase GlpK [Acidimicrobiia bacterium]|nr:glycerol kinase GlpK [Acidimicrobiia bacterium]